MRRMAIGGAALLICGAAAGAELSGTWKIDSSVGENPVVIHCTLVQAGDALTGQCRPQVDGIEPSAVTGSVTGAKAKWGYDVVFNGNPGRVDYEADVAADGSLRGTLFLSGNPTPFTAAKL